MDIAGLPFVGGAEPLAEDARCSARSPTLDSPPCRVNLPTHKCSGSHNALDTHVRPKRKLRSESRCNPLRSLQRGGHRARIVGDPGKGKGSQAHYLARPDLDAAKLRDDAAAVRKGSEMGRAWPGRRASRPASRKLHFEFFRLFFTEHFDCPSEAICQTSRPPCAVSSLEARIPAQHPLRAMRRLTNAALAELDARFPALYEGIGRPSIPPERLLRASLCSFSSRSARSGRWSNGWSSTCCFAGSSGLRSTRGCSTPRPSRRTATACSRTRLRKSSSLLGLPEMKGLLSAEHFSVDGTMLKPGRP
jgi:hypothetical protein